MSMVPSLDDSMYLYLCVLPVGLTSVHVENVEALTEASEANESNTASRTRSIGQHFVLLVTCRPYYLKVSRNEKNDDPFASLFAAQRTIGRQTGLHYRLRV